MVRVPGSSGDLGFYREPLSEKVNIKTIPRIEAPAAEGSSQTREDEGFPISSKFWEGFDDEKRKEEDRSHDLEENPQLHPEASSGATADRTAKRKSQDESPRGIPKRFSFILDEPSEMMKRETRRSEDFKKLAVARTSPPDARSRRRR